MKLPADYWKNFWDEQARKAGSDFALNRRTNVRLEGLEQKSELQFLAAVKPQSSDIILDAGCGSGRNISLLSPLVKEIIGMDYSTEMLARAREKVISEKLSNVELMPGDITNLKFPSSTFDKVVCASVLQYLDEKNCALALNEMTRVCKPGGRLVLHIKNGCSLYGISLNMLRPVARLLGKKMKPEFYRSARWHERRLNQAHGTVLERDGFGILTFNPLPAWGVRLLLNVETRLHLSRYLKRFAVNYKLTVRVDKADSR